LPGHFSEEETKESGMVLHAGKHDYAEGKGLYGMEDVSLWQRGIDRYNRLIETIYLIQICT